MTASPPEPVDLERLRALIRSVVDDKYPQIHLAELVLALPGVFDELTALRAVRDAAEEVAKSYASAEGDGFTAWTDQAYKVLRLELDRARPKP